MNEAVTPPVWRRAALGELTESIQAGRSPDLEDVPAGPGQWGVLKVSAISPNGFRSNENKVATEPALISAALEVQPGDLLLSRANTMELVGLCCIATNPRPNLMLSDKILRIVPKRFEMDPVFLFVFLSSTVARRQIQSLATGTSGGMKNISQEAIRSLLVPCPPLEEQQRVGEILGSIDQAIQLREHHCSKLQQIGLGVTQNVLNAITISHRSDGRGGGWPLLPLEELAGIAAGLTLGSEPTGPSTIRLPYLRVANVQDGHIDTSEVKTVRVLRTQVDSYRLRPGDVLLTEGGDYDKLGRGAVWDGRIPVCLHQNHVFCVRPDDSRLSSDFLAMYTASPAGRHYFLSIAKQTTNLASINSTQLRRMPIPIPSRDEQDRLMRPVHAVRECIEEETAELAKLRLMKQGLVEDILDGKVRVP
jgi:type I restriction enzyme S subunit